MNKKTEDKKVGTLITEMELDDSGLVKDIEKESKITVGDKEVEQIDSFKISGSGGEDVFDAQTIKDFILDAGSDHLPTFGGKFEGGIHLQQVADEITPCLVELLKYKKDIKSFLEIGSAAGGSAFIFNHFFDLETIVLIDDNKHGKHGLRGDVLKGINRQEIIGRSDDESVMNEISNLNVMFDLILVDSEHDYRQVKVEVAAYMPFLKPGGFLFLHDTVYSPDGDGRVVRELKNDIGMEFIDEYVAEEGPKLGIALFRKRKVAL